MKKELIFYGVKYFPSKGGTSRVVENIAIQLADKYKITMYCYKNPKAKTNIAGVDTVQFAEFPFGALGVFIYYFVSAFHIIFTKKKSCIIHTHKTDCAFFLPLLKLKFKNIIATSHEAPYHRDKWNVIGKAYFRLVEYIFMYSGVKLTSISKPLAEYYEDKYEKEVMFIPNGISPVGNIGTQSAQSILDKYRIKEPYIMYSARRIMSTKGLHTMIEAIHIMKSKIPVVIVGDEDHAQRYVNRLKKKYKHLNLFFLGFVELPVLLGLIKMTDLFVFPSETEGMSIMLLEVVSVGSSIICSDIPENLQVFSKEEILYFKSKDATDLKEKIKFALSNKDSMQEFSRRAQKKIHENYLWESISAKYADIY